MDYRYIRFPGGKQKAVTFSYDDGIKADIRLCEIFDKYNMKATFNINSSRIANEPTDWYLTKEEIKEHIIGGGHEIAVHGKFHLAPGKLRSVDIVREFLDCRFELEDKFDMIIRGMAYPFSGVRIIQNGRGYEDIRDILKNIDIVYSRTLGEDNNSFLLPVDWHNWIPSAHHDNENIFEYINQFTSISNDDSVVRDYRYARLFYIWGHSYEFDRHNNWDRIEKICSQLGGQQDVWYATNIEIYDYVTAFNSLIFSADGSRVYNPTDKTVWFENIGDGIFSVEPGKTIKLK